MTTTGKGMSALHLAARAGQTEAVQILLGSKKFEAVNRHASRPGNRHTALHSAASAGHEAVVALLLGSYCFSAIAARASRDHTALQFAVGHARVGVAGLADVNVVSNTGATALHFAALSASINVANLP